MKPKPSIRSKVLRMPSNLARQRFFVALSGRPWKNNVTCGRHLYRGFSSMPRSLNSDSSPQSSSKRQEHPRLARVTASVVIVALLVWALYPADLIQHEEESTPGLEQDAEEDGTESQESGAWARFTSGFDSLTFVTEVEWSKLGDKVAGLVLPEWSIQIPGLVRKLQRELSMAPGSLADEIWREARDPMVHPDIQYSAKVRVSEELCEDEKRFLGRRRKMIAVALARYLDLDEDEIHPEDVPTIAVCGSGGGLRALIAGTGSLMATQEDGLFDCVTYTSGVSGSCWLQALYYSSLSGADFGRLMSHLKARLGVHLAYPPAAISSLVTAPTNKCLLSGLVEKLRGDANADFGLVDVYGLLLASRLLVPKGELGVNDGDFKLSNQAEYLKYGQNPLPIYTAVRHEIPGLDTGSEKKPVSAETGHGNKTEEEAKKEAWFQWFEITPYEFFCEEFSAGIPTWAMGRKYKAGSDVPTEDGLYLPETRAPLLLGAFGSAFCATLSHYYREIRPLVLSLTGLQTVDDMISDRNENLSKVHPIDPATLPNFVYGMEGRLPSTTPQSLYKTEYIQLMDAGMSNNLPIYPLLRPGRDVEVIIAFDASRDIRTDNWLSVAEGYVRQRGIKGWPVGIGWPRNEESVSEMVEELSAAQADSGTDADSKLAKAQQDQARRRAESAEATTAGQDLRPGDESAGELGYCTVWVGSKQERSTDPPPPPSKAMDYTDASSWKQMQSPDAGLAVVYLPFLANEARVPEVDPATSEYMSTWNFVYQPDEIEKVVALAKANYDEAKARLRATVRAVYERKKKMREEREERASRERFRRRMRLGVVGKLGEGDHFS